MPAIEAVIFDWGDTVMRDFPGCDGPMVSWPRVELMPGADRGLADLSERYLCCLASNAGISDAELMGEALDRVCIRHYFRHLWTSKELGAAKPAPAFFLGIVSRLGLAPAQCVMVGNDYSKDIAGARAAGLRTVWLNPTGAAAPGPCADAVITTLVDLPRAISGL